RHWQREPMRLVDNDRWCGRFTPPEPARYEYAIEAWTDEFATWRKEFLLKRNAGQDVSLEAREGRELISRCRPSDYAVAAALEAVAQNFDRDGAPEPLLWDDVAAAMAEHAPRPDL